MERCFRPRSVRFTLVLAIAIVLSLSGGVAFSSQPGASAALIPLFAPPANDNFASATAITSLPFSDRVDTTDATAEANEPQNCNGTSYTVWYTFTPATNMWVRADMGGGQYEVNLSVYSAFGPDFTGLSYITCSSWGPLVEFQAQAGVTYYFQAGSIYGPGTLQLNVSEILPPANDDFANAEVIPSLPFSHNADTRAATTEPNEPTSTGCGPTGKTIWYTYTPASSGSLTIWADSYYNKLLAVYTGSDIAALTAIKCAAFWGWGPLTFKGEAGTTYYFQAGSLDGNAGPLSFRLEVTPPPSASFGFWPSQPSIFNTVQFYNNSYDPAQMGIQTVAWDLGDGTTSTEWSASHLYAKDGDYAVNLTVTTPDDRTASTAQTVRVVTHDVAIVRLVAPNSASVGQTRTVSVEIKNVRYPERVRIELSKSVPGGSQWVAATEQNVPVRSGNRTTSVSLSYTFAAEDAMMGKVTFRASAYIVDQPDALPADNEAISGLTKVGK